MRREEDGRPSKKMKTHHEQGIMDILSLAVDFLDVHTATKMRLLCKVVDKYIENNYPWRKLYEHKFGKEMPFGEYYKSGGNEHRIAYFMKQGYRKHIKEMEPEQEFNSVEELSDVAKKQLPNGRTYTIEQGYFDLEGFFDHEGEGDYPTDDGNVNYASYKNEFTGDVYHRFHWYEGDNKNGAVWLNDDKKPLMFIIDGDYFRTKNKELFSCSRDDLELRDAIGRMERGKGFVGDDAFDEEENASVFDVRNNAEWD